MGRRIPWRKPNGRYVRPPSLEALGLVRICPNDGRIIVGNEDPDRPGRRTFPPCPACGWTQEPSPDRTIITHEEGEAR